jgi:predicted small metal-binding protein
VTLAVGDRREHHVAVAATESWRSFGGEAMRGFDCGCGEYVEAENDQRLLERMRTHADEAHTEEGFTDAQLARMAEDGAYDVRSDASA